jgi:A/G-specific adenine glycosylase
MPPISSLLERRPANASQMAGMLELPVLASDSGQRNEPVLRVKHSITNTNYDVWVYAKEPSSAIKGNGLEWVSAKKLHEYPLTGLARKVLLRLQVMQRQQARD